VPESERKDSDDPESDPQSQPVHPAPENGESLPDDALPMLGGKRSRAGRELRDSTSQLITLLQRRLDSLMASDDPRAAQIAIDCAKELAEIKRQIRALDGDGSAIDPEDL
jgi:hypothetical protein